CRRRSPPVSATKRHLRKLASSGTLTLSFGLGPTRDHQPQTFVRFPSLYGEYLFAMTQYCCYSLDDWLCVVDCRGITCETDATARILANDLLAENVYSAIEVWDGQRQVHEAKKLQPA